MNIKRFSSLFAVLASFAVMHPSSSSVSALPIADSAVAANDLPPIPGLLQDSSKPTSVAYVATTIAASAAALTSPLTPLCPNAASCPSAMAATIPNSAANPTITMTYMLTQTQLPVPTKTPEPACVAPAAATVPTMQQCPQVEAAAISCPAAKPLVAAEAAQIPTSAPTTIYTYMFTKNVSAPTPEAACVPAVTPSAQAATIPTAPAAEKCPAAQPATTATVFYTATYFQAIATQPVLADTSQKSARDDKPLINQPVTAEELPPSISNPHQAAMVPVIVPPPIPPIIPPYQISTPPAPVLPVQNVPQTSAPVQYFTIFTTPTPPTSTSAILISAVTVIQTPLTVFETITLGLPTTTITSSELDPTTTISSSATKPATSSVSTIVSTFTTSAVTTQSEAISTASLASLTPNATSTSPALTTVPVPTGRVTPLLELSLPAGITIPDPSAFQQP